MLKKIKNFIIKSDRFLFKKFGYENNVKFLENLSEAKTLFYHLNKDGKTDNVKFVGGCVRKALSGQEIDDIDLATSLEPNEVKKRLADKNIKLLDTGIEHGTITVIINKKKFEITTLRKDLSTDGRHANVEFTEDWKQDSLRRDLTINAIYADLNGQIYDPLNGMEDLKLGKVQFIGSPAERIQEDYLRILRYFRFFTTYSKIDHNQDVIKYIKQNINGLNKVSNERIFDELKKILLLKNIYSIFKNQNSKEIFLKIFPQFNFYERLKNFDTLNRKLKDKYDQNHILALLIVDHTNNYDFFCYKYKIPNNVKKKLKIISENFDNLKNKKFYLLENIKKFIYFNGKEITNDLLLFGKCLNNKAKISDFEKLLSYVNSYKIPKFPISGNYLKEKYGYESGVELGKHLKLLEDKWVKNNFVIDKDIIKNSLN